MMLERLFCRLGFHDHPGPTSEDLNNIWNAPRDARWTGYWTTCQRPDCGDTGFHRVAL